MADPERDAARTSDPSAETSDASVEEKKKIPEPPHGSGRLKWLGPGLVWMAAGAGGAGELLFPPRVGSLYGYAFLWALVMAVFLKWFIVRELGRTAVGTGEPLLEGMRRVPGPKNWALWALLIPQIVVAVAALAGLAGSASTAVTELLGVGFGGGGAPVGDGAEAATGRAIEAWWTSTKLWMPILLALATALVVWGQYSAVETAATVLTTILALAALVTAISVFPPPGKLLAGLVPQVPPDTDFQEIVPWLSFILAGAAGLVWYSYWVPAKGYGAAGRAEFKDGVLTAEDFNDDEARRLEGWTNQMGLDVGLGVVGGFLIVLSFLILGTELLAPEGIVPEEDQVASVLGRLLGGVWGPVGYWFMIVGVLIGFWNTVLTNQDGWARMFGNGVGILTRQFGVTGRWAEDAFLKRAFAIGLLGVVPALLYVVRGEPVVLLQLAGIVEAVHIPFVAAMTLWINKRLLPERLRPGWFSTSGTVLAGLFYAGFAAVYFYTLLAPSS